MDRRFISLVEEVNNFSLDNIKNNIRNSIYNEIARLRKNDQEIEYKEKDYWNSIIKNDYKDNKKLEEHKKLRELVCLYATLKSLNFEIGKFLDLVNED